MSAHRRTIILGMAAAALAACSPPAEKAEAPPAGEINPASAAIIDPAILVRGFYERYRTDAMTTVFPPLELQAPWSEQMRNELLAMMSRSEARNEPILDFDPFIGAQDWELQNVNVTTDAVSENSHAVVRAAVTNAGFSEDIVYDLVWQNGEWRVDNIRGRDWDLRQIATQP